MRPKPVVYITDPMSPQEFKKMRTAFRKTANAFDHLLYLGCRHNDEVMTALDEFCGTLCAHNDILKINVLKYLELTKYIKEYHSALYQKLKDME